MREGVSLDAAVVDAGALRFRPIFMTAMAVIVGGAVILFDPTFQGLAISEIASLLISRMRCLSFTSWSTDELPKAPSR